MNRSMDEIRAALAEGDTTIESEVQIITRFIETFDDIFTSESDLKVCICFQKQIYEFSQRRTLY